MLARVKPLILGWKLRYYSFVHTHKTMSLYSLNSATTLLFKSISSIMFLGLMRPLPAQNLGAT